MHKPQRQSNTEMQQRMVSVLIADDHKLISEALKIILVEEGDFSVETSVSLQSTLDVLRAHPKSFDVVMLDISMPGMEGLRSVKQVVDATHEGSVVIFSGTADDDFVWQAIEIGAKGFISKGQPFRSFAATLRLIADGNEFVPLSLSRSVKNATKGADGPDEQERRILKLVAEGKTNKEIAFELNSSEVAIKMKMRSICTKLDAKNRAHAAILAQRHGLITIDT
ncbi:two component transcriptional regulator, LuxR family [Celeribacter baekdonensis]|uniref:Two component transcriptional regulator, LuxR family n=1 Tax=Celeribacter baekdonensis TaxID=875171 RepID=A0A1G7JI81_9RHOB|nr:response regulator transcription factor [Celeribacter baekdonensis]SDF24606.1 two component transcriptional regulator, LuxR family [Celeribacter baekdonensis]